MAEQQPSIYVMFPRGSLSVWRIRHENEVVKLDGARAVLTADLNRVIVELFGYDPVLEGVDVFTANEDTTQLTRLGTYSKQVLAVLDAELSDGPESGDEPTDLPGM